MSAICKLEPTPEAWSSGRFFGVLQQQQQRQQLSQTWNVVPTAKKATWVCVCQRRREGESLSIRQQKMSVEGEEEEEVSQSVADDGGSWSSINRNVCVQFQACFLTSSAVCIPVCILFATVPHCENFCTIPPLLTIRRLMPWPYYRCNILLRLSMKTQTRWEGGKVDIDASKPATEANNKLQSSAH